MTGVWLQFGFSAAVVVTAGVMVGRVSGEIGERLNLGRAWAGSVLLAFATTLPELVSCMTVALRGNPAMAVGGILGSIAFNLFILVLADLAVPEPIYDKLSPNHMAAGLLGCLLLGILVTGLAAGAAGGGVNIGLGHVGFSPALILGMYLLGQFVLYRLARGSYADVKQIRISTPFNRMSLRGLAGVYAAAAAAILAAAYGLGVSAEAIAARYGLGATFAGALLIGVVTSLPEITNALACARQREFDLAVGNILGANAIVLTVLAIVDVVYLPGRLLTLLSRGDALSAIAMAGLAVVMQGVVLGALAVRSAERVWRVGIASVMLAALYALALFISYRFSLMP